MAARAGHPLAANTDFEPLVVTGADAAEVQMIAELVDVLEHDAFSTEVHSR